MKFQIPSRVDKIDFPFLNDFGIELFLKRDDLIHSVISGNKWRKLKYNLERAKKENYKTLLTFGGAFSNHIHATAFAAKEFGLKSIGVIRDPSVLRTSPLTGESEYTFNPTLQDCQKFGMQLHFISREDYNRKTENEFISDLKNKFGDFYLIPEGGANSEGILGCKEILEEEKEHYDFICCAAGTGTTLTGILLSLRKEEKLIGFPALKGGEFIKEEIEKNISNYFSDEKNRMNSLQIITDYHFGGYAKVNDDLKNFVSDFFVQTQIQLDYIYNGKMMYGLMDLIKKGNFPKNTRILAIHTGGTQGNRGFLK